MGIVTLLEFINKSKEKNIYKEKFEEEDRYRLIRRYCLFRK